MNCYRCGLIAILPLSLLLAGCPSESGDPPSGTSGNAGSESHEIQMASVTAIASKLTGDAKAAYEEAKAAEPFPNQSQQITGPFHGTFSDGEFSSTYLYDRQPDGLLTHTTLDLYGEEQEFQRVVKTFHWSTEGRVIYEQDPENPDLVYFLMLDQVTADGLKYRMIDPENGLGELMESEDARGKVDFPPVPDGWEEREE